MSAAQTQSSLESRLEALQCHFTWDLDPSRSKLLRLGDELEDIGTEEGNSWTGHIYNLQGFIHHQLGSIEEARRFFSRATEALGRIRETSEGPWLVVNYSNLAWLHHRQGEEEESEGYLSKVDALMKKYPSPSQDELHPEVCAEKAWTLMKFSKDQKLQAADYFQRAIRMQPDRVEWQTSRLLGLINAHKHDDDALDADILEELRLAREQDPENLYLAVQDLQQRAKKGEQVQDEARELAEKILKNPVSSYSGMKPLLRLYREHVSIDEAIELAEEALKNHPEERFLKRCAALCYKWKIMFYRDGRLRQSSIDRAISLHKEVVPLYPHSSLMKEVDLANVYAKSRHGLDKAEQIYQELLQRDLEDVDQQMVYHYYAKYLYFDQKEPRKSTQYHKMAAAIPHQSFFRDNSIKVLERVEGRSKRRVERRVEELLRELKIHP